MSAPYYIEPYLEELATTEDAARRKKLRQLIAVNIGDSDALADLLGLTQESFADFYPDVVPELDTVQTIDSFLERFGDKSTGDAFSADGGVIPMAPAVDYASAFLSESPAEIEPEAEMDNNSLEAEEIAEEKAEETEGKKRQESLLSESFARLMIKNGNYRKALEIITQLNLKNPEKSIYFADQIRFLRKLIINENKK